jgi:hypothetical protein
MQNANKKKLAIITALVTVMLYISGCSLTGNQFPANTCLTTFDTSLHETLNTKTPSGATLKDAPSYIYSYKTISPTFREEVKCVMFNLKDKVDNITYVTFYISEPETVLQYILDPKKDLMLEVQIVPSDDSVDEYDVTIATMFPLNSMLANLKSDKEDEKPVVLLDQKEGVTTKKSFQETLALISNGKFPQAK